jgi:hypothetical protein
MQSFSQQRLCVSGWEVDCMPRQYFKGGGEQQQQQQQQQQ